MVASRLSFVLVVVVLCCVMGSIGKPGKKEKCPKNEVFFKCGPNCQSECATLNQPCTATFIQCPSGCYCLDGYARLESGKCVLEELCSDGEYIQQPEAIS